ncbi:hypothetical protein D1007_40838 [Hordeum vulgare]|nr:hypothetical protein D1007_40838 [Hordeum vulgare]
MDHPHSATDHHITQEPFIATVYATLPDDLVVWEILVRLPVKYLMLYKYIFPSWGAATAEAGFVRRHRDLSRMEPLSMLVIPRKSSIEDEFELSQDISFHHLRVENTLGTIRNNEEVDLMLEKVCPPEEEGIANKIFPTHCNGLVCIATNMDQVFVCNPATHELVALPRGTPDVRDVKEPSAVLGFDASRNQYVVARYFYQYFHNNTSSRVLSYEIGHELEDDGTRQPQWSPLCSINPLNRDLGAEAFFPVWAGWGGIIVFVDYEKLYWYEEKIGYMKELVDLEEEVDFERQRLHYGGNFYRSHVIPYMESLISIRMCNY